MDGQPADPEMTVKWFSAKDCKGSVTLDMSKGQIKYGQQYDMPGVVSVSVSRDLMNDEQMDFSTVPAHKLRRSGDNSTMLEERGKKMPLDCE